MNDDILVSTQITKCVCMGTCVQRMISSLHIMYVDVGGIRNYGEAISITPVKGKKQSDKTTLADSRYWIP